MSPRTPLGPLEERLRTVTAQIEDDLRKVMSYMNDEVVPEVRRSGSEALRYASAELRKLAERLEDANGSGPQAPR